MKNAIQTLFLLIVPLLTYSQANNNNNGRSNRDKCCKDGVVITDFNNQGGTLNHQSIWYEKGTSIANINKRTSNPISKSTQTSSITECNLFSSNGKFVSNISITIENENIIIPKMDLKDGSYYLEIVMNKKTYRTGISIDDNVKSQNKTKRKIKN